MSVETTFAAVAAMMRVAVCSAVVAGCAAPCTISKATIAGCGMDFANQAHGSAFGAPIIPKDGLIVKRKLRSRSPNADIVRAQSYPDVHRQLEVTITSNLYDDGQMLTLAQHMRDDLGHEEATVVRIDKKSLICAKYAVGPLENAHLEYLPGLQNLASEQGLEFPSIYVTGVRATSTRQTFDAQCGEGAEGHQEWCQRIAPLDEAVSAFVLPFDTLPSQLHPEELEKKIKQAGIPTACSPPAQDQQTVAAAAKYRRSNGEKLLRAWSGQPAEKHREKPPKGSKKSGSHASGSPSDATSAPIDLPAPQEFFLSPKFDTAPLH